MQCLSQYEIACVERHQSKAHGDPSPNEATWRGLYTFDWPIPMYFKIYQTQYIHKYISYQYIFRQFLYLWKYIIQL